MPTTKLAITEIFPSIQGEGYWTGTPCLFIRFAGCNRKCTFCDTDFSKKFELTDEELLSRIREQVSHHGFEHVVLTGGEPTLQVSVERLNRWHDELDHFAPLRFQIETNGQSGSHQDYVRSAWVTWSPKEGDPMHLHYFDEVKLVHDYDTQVVTPLLMRKLEGMPRNPSAWAPPFLWLQPAWRAASQDTQRNYAEVLALLKHNPRWRLSNQTHKLITALNLAKVD